MSYTVNNITYKNGSGETLDSIPESGSFIAEVSATKTGDVQGNAYIVVAAYDEDGTLLGMNYSYADVPDGTSFTFGLTVDQPDGKKASSVKAFVWDGLSSMEPLAFGA